MGLKVIVAGKGGVGKTTVASLLSLFLSSEGKKVLAVDTDSLPNLAISLGVPRGMEIIPIVKNEELVEERTGARPGESWGIFFRLNPKVDDIVEKYGLRLSDNLSLLVVGSIDSAKQGCLCPAISLGKALISHLLLSEDEAIVVDSEAGAEVFGRGLAERFDVMLCVTEPTLKSIQIAKSLAKMGRELGIREIYYIVNKFRGSEEDRAKISAELDSEHFFIPYDDALLRAEVEGRSLRELNSSPAVSSLFQVFREIFGG